MKLIERRGLFAITAGVLAAPAVLRAQTMAPAQGTMPMQGVRSIAETIAGDTRFSRLMDLLVRASMTDVLRGPGPFTLFAPVDTAFNSAPAGVLNDLLGNQESGNNQGDRERDRLAALLNYHVVSGAFPAQQLMGQNRSLSTVNGGAIQLSSQGTEMTLQNPAPAAQLGSFGAAGAQVSARPARVVQANIPASNGVIHAIDQILWP